MKKSIRTLGIVLIWIAVIIGGSFVYYYATHREDCQEWSQCFRAFKESVQERYESIKQSIHDKFSEKSCC